MLISRSDGPVFSRSTGTVSVVGSFEQRFRLHLGSVFDSKVVHVLDDAIALEHFERSGMDW
jgi:hypothetical protein